MDNNIDKKLNNRDKYIALFVLHALGDTIGFKNGDWEFNYNKETDLSSILEFVYEFIDLGGVNGIILKGWRVSDDTLYHMAIALALLHFEDKIDDKFILQLKNSLILVHNRLVHEKIDESIKRYPGYATEKYIQKFDLDEKISYDPATGGNGAAMRNLCVGAAFHKEEQIEMLVDVSIVSSKLTHNSPLGFLAGMTSAYFVSLAISGTHIFKWPSLLIDLLNSDMVKKHIDMTNNDVLMDYMMYIKYWKQYIESRFLNEEPLKKKIFTNLMYRIKYYYQNFVQDTKADAIGGSGFCAMIMAYDCLVDCDGKWEKLIFYSMLHPGDSDTVGAIAGGMYGALYGFGDVPNQMLDYLEEKNEILSIGDYFYKMYFLNEKIVLDKEIQQYNRKHIKRSK